MEIELSLAEMRRNIYRILYAKICERMDAGSNDNLENEINFLLGFINCINFSVEREPMQ